MSGFLRLADQVEGGDLGALRDFSRAGVALVADHADHWEQLWCSGPLSAAQRTGEHLKALREGNIDHLMAAAARSAEAPAVDDRRFGMCGRLDTYDLR